MTKFCLVFLFSATMLGQTVKQWIVHYTRIGGGFETVIQITNIDGDKAENMTITPYLIDGTELTEMIQTITVEPGEILTMDREALGWVDTDVSHFSAAGPAVIRVSSVFKHGSRGSMPAFTLSRQVAYQGARWVPVSSENWFDGLVVVNSSSASSSFTLVSYNRAGEELATVEYNIAGHGKWLDVVDNIFGENLDTEGYIRARSTSPLLFFGLRGSRTSFPAVLAELSLDQYVPGSI